MRIRQKLKAALALAVASTLFVSAPAQAVPAESRDKTQQAEPTRSTAASLVADSIGALGNSAYRDVFSGIHVDPAAGEVAVYVTDPVRGRQLAGLGLAAVSSATRSAAKVDIRRSKYSRTQMQAASATIWAGAQQAGVEVYSIVLRDDGAGLEVRTNAPDKAGVLTAAVSAVAGTDIDYVRGAPAQAVSREDPAPPYPGGLPIRWDWYLSGWDCTAAFGVRDSSGTFLLGAEHCYDVDDGIEAMNGNNLGSVIRENNAHDGALIRANSQSGVWVNDDYLFNVRATGDTWTGEYVCQSGYTSYPNRCQIEITHGNTQWNYQDGKGTRYGAEGRRCGGCPAVAHGDSGGPVWSIHPQGGVLARGIVSGGWGVVEENVSYENILFTKVNAATQALGVSVLTS